MTLTTKDSTDPASSSKSTAPVTNPSNHSAQTPRSNPVCLEVSVTIRSLPADSSTQPIREEGRTVIVFDNGAVLRSASNLPAGQTVILSNPSGRDVACRVVGARNMPKVKGYVEVEFIEPVDDFWRIHQSDPAVAVAPRPAASVPRAPAAQAVAPPPAARVETPPSAASSKPEIMPSGSGPSFDDIAGVMSPATRPATRPQRIEPPRPGRDLRAKNEPVQTPAETNGSLAPAAPRRSSSESRNGKAEIQTARATESEDTPNLASSRDFMSPGLLGSETASSSSRMLNDKVPLVIAGAALALASVIGGIYFMTHRSSAPAPAAEMAVAKQPSAPEPASAAQNLPPMQATPAQGASQAQPAVVTHAESAASIAPTPAPATVSSSIARDLQSAQRQEKSTQDKSTNGAKTPELSSSPAIPNLKMKSPSAPKRNLAGQTDAPAPVAEIVPPDAAAGVPSAGLLSAVARSANQPAPPASVTSADPAKTTRDAKPISSARAVYPPTAKVANVQGTVVVLAKIDRNGNVVEVRAESGPMLLRQAALDAVRRWKYSPALADGQPVSTQLSVAVDFKLN